MTFLRSVSEMESLTRTILLCSAELQLLIQWMEISEKTIRKESINCSPKPALKSTVNKDKDIEIVINNNEVDLCVEHEPGTTDL